MFLDKIHAIGDRFLELERQLTLPEVIKDKEKYTAYMREYKNLTPVAEKIRAFDECERAIAGAEQMLTDDDAQMRALAEEEIASLKKQRDALEEEIKLLLIPRDPMDDRNVIVEIRQGVGGEEAALFAADLYRMYTMYAASKGFKTEVVSANETELGGYKEIVFTVSGDGAYSKFKFESGGHRVQRIPVTESNGRIQTSSVTVAVLPEAEAVEVNINPQDVRYETCKSSGAGGQHINKTESAVRLIHEPSGIVIECDQERSQLQNKEKALKMLYAKLYQMSVERQQNETAAERKSQVGTGDRSDKIRTYNFPQSRVTDHRINKTIYTLGAFLNGEIDGMICDLAAHAAADQLKEDSE